MNIYFYLLTQKSYLKGNLIFLYSSQYLIEMNPVMTDKMVKLFSEKIQLISEMEKEKPVSKAKQQITVNLEDDDESVEDIEPKNLFKKQEMAKRLDQNKEEVEVRKPSSIPRKKSDKFEEKKPSMPKSKPPIQIKAPNRPQKSYHYESFNQEVQDDEQVHKESQNFQEIFPVKFVIAMKARRLAKSMIESPEQNNQGSEMEQEEEGYASHQPTKKGIMKSKAMSKAQKKQGKKQKSNKQRSFEIKVDKVKPEYINNIVNQIQTQVYQTINLQVRKLAKKYSIDNEVIQYIYENKDKYGQYVEKNESEREKKNWANQSNAEIIAELHKRLYIFFEKNKDCDLQKLVGEANRVLAMMGIPKEKHEKLRKEWIKQFSSQSKRK